MKKRSWAICSFYSLPSFWKKSSAKKWLTCFFLLCGSQINMPFFLVKSISGKLRVFVFFHRKFIILKIFRNCWIYYWNLIVQITFQIWNKVLNCRTNKTATRILTCVNIWSFSEYALPFYSTYLQINTVTE